jgi:two-component system chemotaxis response regulator CheY
MTNSSSQIDRSEHQLKLKPFRSLVVEDDFSCRILLQGLLSKYGQCDAASTGREGVKAFRASLSSGNPYQLITMDIQMPGLDGREALTQIRAIERHHSIEAAGVKILMTTTLHDTKTVFSAFGAKCDEYLVKPVHGRNLAEQLAILGLLVHEDPPMNQLASETALGSKGH